MQHERFDEPEALLDGLTPRAERQRTVLVNAAIVQHGADGLCRIRNVSEGGLAVETSLPLCPGPAQVHLRSGDIVDCTVRWAREGRAGLSLEQPGSAADLVARRIAPEHEQPGFGFPRFERSVAVGIAVRGRPYRCMLHSIAPTDVWLIGAPEFPRGEPLTVSVKGLGDLMAMVHEAEKGEMVALFHSALSFRQLDPWLASTALAMRGAHD